MIQDTSTEARESVEPHLQRLEAMVLNAIVGYGGLTCEQVEEKTGLKHQTASARIRELAKREVIVASEERRKTSSGRSANVWTKWSLV